MNTLVKQVQDIVLIQDIKGTEFHTTIGNIQLLEHAVSYTNKLGESVTLPLNAWGLPVGMSFDDPRFLPILQGILPRETIEILLVDYYNDEPISWNEVLTFANYGLVLSVLIPTIIAGTVVYVGTKRRLDAALQTTIGVDLKTIQLGINLLKKAGVEA